MRIFPLVFVLAASLSTLPAGIIISEFLADNVRDARDEDGDEEDWIELSNTGTSTVDLGGWYLTDDAADLEKWEIPAGLNLGPNGEFLFFASGKDREVGELHTNFRLESDGGYLALVQPDGVTVEFEYSPYPKQFPDVSYGIASPGGATVMLVGAGAPLKWKVPTDDSEDVNNPVVATPWNAIDYEDGAWNAGLGGVGYATAADDDYDNFIGAGSDLQAEMRSINQTAYVRFPFEIEDPAGVTTISFGARWEDGFAIYINGGSVPLLSMNSPAGDALAWDSGATASNPDSAAEALETFSISRSSVNLVAGTNVLAVQVMNRGSASSDLLFDPELEAVIVPTGAVDEAVYMTTTTPAVENGLGVSDLGPVFRQVTESAPAPDVASATEIVVTAQVDAAGDPVDSVTLFHRQMFEAEASAPMLDDGVAPDASAGDGVYTAAVPLAGLVAGKMVRWRFGSADSDGTISREPFFADPLNSPEYFGTVALDPSITTGLPVLHWFPENFSAAGTRTGTRSGVYHNGEFYDNVFTRVRGGSSTGLSKKSYKFDFNTGHHFRWSPDAPRAEEFNLNTTWTDKSYIRQPLSYEVYDAAGSPGPECFPIHVRWDGMFFSIAAFTEQVDKRLLDREPMVDDDGALYKMFNTFTSGTSGVEKKTRRTEANSDLVGFVAAINDNTGAALEAEIFDRVDIPRQLSYLAAGVLCQNDDNVAKNYYLYRDTKGTGEWFQMAWDTDLTWGSHFMTNDNIAHDGIWADEDYVLGGRAANVPINPSHPFVGTQALPANRSWNRLADKLYSDPRFADMFRRRLRTLMDEIFAPPVLDDRIDELETLIATDAAADRATWGQFGMSQTLEQALAVLENDYLAVRRTHLFDTHLVSNAASYPTPQTSSALLPDALPASFPMVFGAFEASPASLDQDEEFIEVQNPNAFAVDLSGWSLTGGVEYTFTEGVVVEAGGSVYVSPDVPEFRARLTSPTGGEGHFVQGDYQGQLSTRGEIVDLNNAAGTMVAQLSVPPDPSPPQSALRITELYYDPIEGGSMEFIELKNVGATTLDLEGVAFTDGVDFVFAMGASLDPGEIGILVRDGAAYGGLNVLGTYAGALNNGGEQVTLRDAAGENILSFEFDGDWFPPARGFGYSIEILDETAPWDSWDLPESWALSCVTGGSPGVQNPAEHSTAFAEWARANLVDLPSANPFVDGDGDGLLDVLNYALAGGRDELPQSGEHDGHPTLTYRALEKAADLAYVVERSTDLENWVPIGETVGLPVDNGDGTFSYTVRSDLPLSEVRQFMRLRVEKTS